MKTLEMIREYGHEEVAFFNNEKAGLKCIIAIHSTKLGPALGGCRLWPYESEEDALFDVLRLSRGMSFKNAAAGLPIGGGKGVIIADPSQKTDALFEAYAECVESLGGRYLTAEDVNTDTHDADIMLRKTNYVVGRANVSGDPSPFTAIGCFDGIRATAKSVFGSDDLEGKTIALQSGSSAEDAVNDAPDFKKSVKDIVFLDQNLMALNDLVIGGVDGVVMDSVVAEYAIAESGMPLVLLDESLASEEYGIAFRKQDAQLTDAVQKTLEEMAADGTVARISTAWFGSDITVIGK